MSIATEIERIQGAKADIKTAIEAKGVTVPSNAKIDDYDTYIGQISGGGGKFKPHEMSFANRNIKSGETSRVTALQNDINNIDTSEMTYMYRLFLGLFASSPLYEDEISLDLSGWDTSHVTNMNEMFAEQYIPPFTLNISNVDLSSISNSLGFSKTFQSSKLKNLIVPNVKKTCSTRIFDSVFAGCSLIEELDLDFVDNKNATTVSASNGISKCFQNCTSLKKVKMKNIHFYPSQGSNKIDYAFYGCTKLERIDIDNLDFSYVSSMTSGYRYCFTNCGSELPEGQYTKVYVKDQKAQNWILNLNSTNRPAGWSTANVIIAGSAADDRVD